MIAPHLHAGGEQNPAYDAGSNKCLMMSPIQANRDDAFAELMYFHPSWPLPDNHQPPSSYAVMLERTAEEWREMLREEDGQSEDGTGFSSSL